MKLKESLLTIMIMVFFIFANAANQAVLVHNTRQDIEACKGKLKLKLVRVWGGDEEEDENKFFKTPFSVVKEKQGLVYICDSHNHHIKVFEDSGQYVRTIGRRGRGPGDLYCPSFMTLSPDGDLVVLELSGHRIQRFNPEGKSKKIIKTDDHIYWVGVTSKNQLLVYDPNKTFNSRKLLSLWDDRGNTVKEIGTYHDKIKTFLGSDKLSFAIDEQDNIYAMNMKAPVIRKYTPDGTMIMAVTFDFPFEAPVKISLNERGDEIKRVEKGDYEEEFREKRQGGSVTIQRKGKKRRLLCRHMGMDPEKRIYLVTSKRIRTLDEISKGPIVMWSQKFVKVIDREKASEQKLDYLRILVFNPEGKVIAEAPLNTYCDGMYVNGNRMFIMDSAMNQCILEYEIQIED